MLRASEKRLHLGQRLSLLLGGQQEPFVSATLLDDFNRANETPMAGNWSKLNSADAVNLNLNTNQVAAGGSTTGGSYWNAVTHGPDCSAHVLIATKPGSGNTLAVLARVGGGGGSNTWDSYQVAFAEAAGTDTWTLDRVVNNTATTLTSGSREFAINERCGIRCVGTLIQAWVCDTSGNWIKLGEATDVTLTTAGNVGIRLRGTTGRLDDFYAGTI